MTAPLAHAVPVVIIGDAQDIREFLCGPIQHNEHTKAWRWHMYVKDDAKRWDAVKAELALMKAQHRARLAQLQHEVSELEDME